MVAALRSVFALLLAVVLIEMGFGALPTVLAVQLDAAGASAGTVGTLSAAYFGGLILGSLAAFRLIRRVGHIRAFSALAAILAAAVLGHALVLDALVWTLLRLIAGICIAGLFVCIESWLNQSASSAARGQVMAVYMMALYGAQGVGQYLFTLQGGESGVTVYVMVAMLVALGVVPVALTDQPPPHLPEVRPLGLLRLYRASPLGLVGTVVSGLVTGAFYGLGPVYVRRLGYEVADAALFMSVAVFGGMLLQWPLGWLSDLFDRRKVLVGLLVALLLSSLAMAPAEAGGFGLLLAGVALFGGIVFALYPVCVAHTNDHLDASDMVAASGGLVLGYSAGAMVGPLLAPLAMGVAGPSGLFLFCALVAGVSFLFGVWRMYARAPVPADRQAPYRPLPKATPPVAAIEGGGE